MTAYVWQLLQLVVLHSKQQRRHTSSQAHPSSGLRCARCLHNAKRTVPHSTCRCTCADSFSSPRHPCKPSRLCRPFIFAAILVSWGHIASSPCRPGSCSKDRSSCVSWSRGAAAFASSSLCSQLCAACCGNSGCGGCSSGCCGGCRGGDWQAVVWAGLHARAPCRFAAHCCCSCSAGVVSAHGSSLSPQAVCDATELLLSLLLLLPNLQSLLLAAHQEGQVGRIAGVLALSCTQDRSGHVPSSHRQCSRCCCWVFTSAPQSSGRLQLATLLAPAGTNNSSNSNSNTAH